MKGLILGLLASMSMTPEQPAGLVAAPARAVMNAGLSVSDWMLSSQLGQSCATQVSGTVVDPEGAVLSLSCATDTAVMGNVTGHLAAQGLKQRRVSISAELQANDAMSASLWLKTQRGSATLMFDDDTEQAVLTDAVDNGGWVRRTVTLPVAADVTQISFGVLLQGSGAVALRAVQVKVSEPGAIAPAAAQLLDAAIAIVRQQTQGRHDLAWQVLEPQLRLFAAGAQSSADAYPAIKYLLSCLGDRQSLLLTPAVAAAFRSAASAAGPAGAVNLFALPDGAQLVLSRLPHEAELRTAQNLSRPAALP